MAAHPLAASPVRVDPGIVILRGRRGATHRDDLSVHNRERMPSRRPWLGKCRADAAIATTASGSVIGS
ncbi:MAG: hypothetical protein K0R13_1987, partial [Propionibacteriaceae bacterium]|nr:hypothetical protein [Propionibacteriaceae bacterium]